MFCVGEWQSCYIEAKTGKSFPALQFVHNLWQSMIGLETIYAISNEYGDHGFVCRPEIVNQINYIGISNTYKTVYDGREIIVDRTANSDTVKYYLDYFEKAGIEKSIIHVIDTVSLSADPFLYLKDDFIKSCPSWKEVIFNFSIT